MRSPAIAKYFDHTILKPAATAAELENICREAISCGFFAVCVNPVHVRQVSLLLTGSGVKTCSVVGFPLGANTTRIKAMETEQAIIDGADEIDMVINIGALKDADYGLVRQDIHAVVRSAGDRTVKVIIETCMLEPQEIVAACQIAAKAGAHFVKTSTGFGGGGATVKDVVLMKKTVADALKVKASGGIKTLKDVEQLIAAGADRIGASAGVAIIKELQTTKK
jgi:deoxyribose-phosphate aldolase